MSSANNMTIEQQLRATWKQERRFCHIRGISRFVIWLALLILLGLLIDWGLLFKASMPAAASVVLGVVGVATLGWVAWRDWFRHLRPYNATRVAMEVEARHPELMSALASYTELDSMSRESQASPELLGAMRDFAISKSQQIRFSDIIDFSQIRKLFAYAAIILLVVGGSGIRWADHFGALFKRIAGIDSSYPIKTRLVSISGDMILPFGSSADIKATAGGVIPDDAILYVKADGSAADWSELPMDKLADGASFRRSLEAPEQDMRYFVTMGDYRSREFVISVVRAPRVVSAEVSLEFPKYLGRPPETTDQLNLEVPEGTRIAWRLKTDKPVGSLAVLHGKNRLDAKIGEDATDLTFVLSAGQSFPYTFEWTEGGSGSGFRFNDVEYSVRVLADTPPRIAFDGIPTAGLATVGKRLKVNWLAQDDHGLDKVWLVYDVTSPQASGEEQANIKKGRVLLSSPEGRPSAKDVHTWVLAKDIPTLSQGQQINYHLEATDRCPDETGERIARSPVQQLSVVTHQEYLEWFRRELATRNDAVQATFISQREVAREIEGLLTEPKGSK
jgi:hypothetical protein